MPSRTAGYNMPRTYIAVYVWGTCNVSASCGCHGRRKYCIWRTAFVWLDGGASNALHTLMGPVRRRDPQRQALEPKQTLKLKP